MHQHLLLIAFSTGLCQGAIQIVPSTGGQPIISAPFTFEVPSAPVLLSNGSPISTGTRVLVGTFGSDRQTVDENRDNPDLVRNLFTGVFFGPSEFPYSDSDSGNATGSLLFEEQVQRDRTNEGAEYTPGTFKLSTDQVMIPEKYLSTFNDEARIFLWILATNNPEGDLGDGFSNVTEHGIFTSSDDNWHFGDRGLDITSISTTSVDEAWIGSYSTTTRSLAIGAPTNLQTFSWTDSLSLYALSGDIGVIPEPASLAAIAGLIALTLGGRRKRP